MKRGLIILIIAVLVLILGVFIIFYNSGDNENSSLSKIKEIFVNSFQSNQTLNNSKETVNNSKVLISTKRRICADQIGSKYAAPLCPCWRMEGDECVEYDYFGVCGTDCSVSCGIFASEGSCESALRKCGDGICENYEKSMDFYYCAQDCGVKNSCYTSGQSFDSSQDSEAKCCEGLSEKSQYDLRNCIVLPSTKFTCVNCGDGICGEGENNCNCVEDCE